MQGTENNRKHRRIPFNGKVLINKSLEVFANDISEGGIFINTAKSLLPGSIVRVSFPDTDIEVTATVQFMPASGGVGLMFEGVKPELAEKIHKFIDLVETQQSSMKQLPTVLIVEDSESVRRLNKTHLVSSGYNVLEAEDGMGAIKTMGSQHIDVVVLDLHMEGMDGYKVMAFMKQNSKLKDIPIIVFSSKFSAEEQSKVYQSGATSFLAKMTTSPQKLLEEITKTIAKHKKAG